ncbi:MAG TPA: AbrB/MazE/SpoVT family DNA-binding domain-containing protein [Negativicutes bacterium]|nr:AbrB/MazE/SpoVT family DNA-binding domain-containing protein [Negativicutes bacterium]
MKTKVMQIGNSIDRILPKEATDRLKIKKGDSVFRAKMPSGSNVSPYGPEFEAQMTVARQGMSEYCNALRELAK